MVATFRLLASDVTDAISVIILQGFVMQQYRNRVFRQTHPCVDENITIGSNRKEYF